MVEPMLSGGEARHQVRDLEYLSRPGPRRRTLERELIDRKSLRTRAEAKMALFDIIEGWYNPRRRHSALGYLSPNDFERVASARDGGPNHPRCRPPKLGIEHNLPLPALAHHHTGESLQPSTRSG